MTIGAVDAEKRTIELAFSSTTPVPRYGINEILSHDPGACDLSRLNDGANLLFNHDADCVLGVVESARIDTDGVGRAVVRFGNSEEAEEAWRDVQDKILTKVSVGYRVMEVKLTEETESGSDTYTVSSWQPYEISIVTIPADTSVGIGRTLNIQKTPIMETNNTAAAPIAPAVAPVEPKIDIVAERNAARSSEQDRVRSILTAGEKYGMSEIALEAVKSGKSVDETRELFLGEMNKRNTSVKEGASPIGLSDKEARSFSFVKLMRALSNPMDRNEQEAAKFEIEACAAAADKVSHRSLKGTMIPVDVLTSPLMERSGTNTVSVKTGSGYTGTGGNTVQTTLLSSSFIEILRNKAVLMQLGTELGGLVGNFDIPKQTTASTGYWIGEDADATKQDVDFGLVSLRPKTVANYSEITRKMLMQSSIAVEALVRNDLARGIALTIDRAGFYGDGSSNAPVGIKSTSGVFQKAFAAANPTFAELVDMETLISQANADVDGMSFVANPSFRGYGKVTRRLATATDSNTIWEPGNSVNGYGVQITNQITSGDVFFGNFADFLVGLWGGLEIVVDPYSNSTKGRLRIVTMQDVDFAVRRASSFAYGNYTAA